MTSEYEKKRMTRIAENRARLEALGIAKSAKALLPPSLKPNSREEDDDYRPGDEEEEEEEEFVGRKRKAKRKNRSDPLGEYDDDEDLNKAIALSLQQEDSLARVKKIQNSGSSKTTNNSDLSKMQMTADELILYFFHFDKAGKGFISLTDVATMATLHDFTWSDDELQHMIRCFDLDQDGKLSLDEFRKVVTRCRMLNES